MKHLYVIIICFLVFACVRSVKQSDIRYTTDGKVEPVPSTWKDVVGMMQGGASCVAIGLKNNKTVLVTADHVMRHNPKYCVFGDKQYDIIDKICHPNKDICFFVINEKIQYLSPINILESKDDIIIGFIKKTKTTTLGRAVPGQSGGGVFSVGKGLYAIVSTTGSGVQILPALEEIGIKLD